MRFYFSAMYTFPLHAEMRVRFIISSQSVDHQLNQHELLLSVDIYYSKTMFRRLFPLDCLTIKDGFTNLSPLHRTECSRSFPFPVFLRKHLNQDYKASGN